VSESASSDNDLAKASGLFLLTMLSMFWVGAQYDGADVGKEGLAGLARGYAFALPLMAILLAHELGHYFAARRHGVDTSLPYFIPMPFALIGTFGALIRMREPARNRNQLFDIGAAGPLSGLVVAVPVLAYGLATSEVVRLEPSGEYMMLGECLLYLGLLRATHGAIPDGYDISLTPTALAGWAGLLVTMMNLVPVGQLDGGHIAYALFGRRQRRYSRYLRRALFVAAVVIGIVAALGAQRAGKSSDEVYWSLLAGYNWLVWALVLTLMARVARGEHPPVDAGALTPRRRVVAWLTLFVFVLLFMPTWVWYS